LQIPEQLSPVAERGLVECILIFARRGRAIRAERERQLKKEAIEVSDTSTAIESAQAAKPLPFHIMAPQPLSVNPSADEKEHQ
jgi:hypothetical protein